MRRRRRRQQQPLRFEFSPPPPSTGPHEARRRRIRWARTSAVLVLLLLLAIVSGAFGFVTAVAQHRPHLEQFTANEPAQVGFIYARNPKDRDCADGSKHPEKCRWLQIGVLRQGEARLLLTPEQISVNMKNAIVAIEDRRFYEHKGFDPEGILRAVFKRVVLGSQEGGSTITQQLIKNTYLSNEQSLRRKFQEAALAYQLEREVRSKPKILAAYLNTIYFGHGCYGVGAAAEYYFGKKASQLEIAESALLAAIPKSPTEFDPIEHPDAARDRRNLVIDAMVSQGYVDPVLGADSKALALLPQNVRHRLTFGATRVPYFTSYVTEQLVNRYGEKVAFNGGLKVYTSIDLREQELAEKTVRDHLKGIGPDGALVSIDPRDATVKAMVGGDGKGKDRFFNLATQGHRQPGSAFKPFVLVAALKKGIQPATHFTSRKVLLPLDQTRSILVKNDVPSYLGSISLPEAMTVSDNTVFAQLTYAVHPEAVVEAAHAMGINSPLDPNLSVGLGGLRFGVTPLEMAHAYGTLAQKGRRLGGSLLFHTPDAGYTSPTQDPISIEKVEFPDGRIEVNLPKVTRAIAETDALSAIDTMRGVTGPGGTAKRAAIPGRTVIGKTGTTSDFKDAWFVGMTPQRVTAVWVGYSNPSRPMRTEYGGKPVFGGTIPAEIFRDFMRNAIRIEPTEGWPNSPGRSQDAFAIDVRLDPWRRAAFGCSGVYELVLALDAAPSAGEAVCKRGLTFVPDMTGKNRKDAANLADGQGLRFEYELVAAKPGQTIGQVVDQVPDPGVQVPVRDPVRAFIAVDVPLVRVPGVTTHGSTRIGLEEAESRLIAMGFRVVIEDGRIREGAVDGTVIGQDIAAGTPAPRGAVVTIAVTGPGLGVIVPDVGGMTVVEARAELATVGLKLAARRGVGGRSEETDIVNGTDVGIGRQVPRGSTVGATTVVAATDG